MRKENLDQRLSGERRGSCLLPFAILGAIVFWVAIGLIVWLWIR